MTFTQLPPEEIERRRKASVSALAERDRDEWDAKYQERCDGIYWRFGRCCAGCDHWSSYAGLTGQCSAAGIMSGADVMRSLGFRFWSHQPEPGYPYTKAKHVCGLFSDSFDWSTLGASYLARIDALRNGKLRAKP